MFPRLFHLYGPLWIQSYGVMIATGFLVFLYLSYNHPIRKKLMGPEAYLNTVFGGLAAGIAGGRILHVLTHWSDFSSNPVEILYPWVPGFFVLGAIIGILVTGPIMLRLQNVPIFPILDLAAIYAPLMQAIARLGCLFAGCCFGIPASDGLPWAVVFTDPAGSAPLNIPLHPAQIYVGIGSFIVFIIVYSVSRIHTYKPGQLIFLYLTLENISRFVVDFSRGDRDNLVTFTNFGITYDLSDVQILSAVFFIITLSSLIFVSCKKRDTHVSF
jgi:phosphatidylglycerol:prolipoprotein diacylglycerol transferase